MVKTAVIPIAGKGTRFLPATKVIAKEIIPILKMPMIYYVVKEAIESGIEQIIFVTASGKNEVEDFFDRNMELEYFLKEKNKIEDLELIKRIGNDVEIVSVRQKEQLGLGHAILVAKNIIQKQNFADLLGDDLTINDEDIPITKQLINCFDLNKGSVVGVMEVAKDKVDRYGIIDGTALKDDAQTYKMNQMIEKPAPDKAPTNLATPGRYVFTPDIFDFLNKIPKGQGGEYQLTDAINLMAQEKAVFAHIFKGQRFDTGSIEGYLEATLHFAWQDSKLQKTIINFWKRNQ